MLFYLLNEMQFNIYKLYLNRNILIQKVRISKTGSD